MGRRSELRETELTELRPRVFISSVMEDYREIRDAATHGIRQAGCQPLRAEDFSAASVSPRNACLDGVRSADALVLLLGARYGFLGPSGLAVTEEEYNEARKSHKHVFVFLQDGVARESQQQAFVDRVQHYVDGHWRKVFNQPADLRELVCSALAAADLAQARRHHARAETRIRSELNRGSPATQNIVWLQAVWTTLRDEEVIDPLDLGDGPFQRQVQRVAHECEPPLFDYEEPKRVSARTSLLRLEQGDFDSWGNGRNLAVAEVHSDGTLVTAQNVTDTKSRTHGVGGESHMFDMYFLDPDVVRVRLKKAWSFAAAWWESLDPHLRHEPLLYSVAVYDIGARKFAPVADHQRNSITIPQECPENPLVVFDRPREISRADLRAPSAEVERVLTLLGRRFEQWANRW